MVRQTTATVSRRQTAQCHQAEFGRVSTHASITVYDIILNIIIIIILAHQNANYHDKSKLSTLVKKHFCTYFVQNKVCGGKTTINTFMTGTASGGADQDANAEKSINDEKEQTLRWNHQMKGKRKEMATQPTVYKLSGKGS